MENGAKSIGKISIGILLAVLENAGLVKSLNDMVELLEKHVVSASFRPGKILKDKTSLKPHPRISFS